MSKGKGFMGKLQDKITCKIKNIDITALLILNSPYIIVFYFIDKISWLYRQTSSMDFSRRFLATIMYLSRAFKNPLPSINGHDLLIALIAAGLFKFYITQKLKKKKKYRDGYEYGSARWGTKEEISYLMSEDEFDNIILTQTEGLMMNGKPTSPEYARNKNIEIVGGSGSGKTRFFIKPNIMQMHCSYVVTDPKGTVLVECGKMLERGTPKRKIQKDKKGNPMKDANGLPVYKKDKHGKPVYVRDKKGKIIYEPYNIKVLNTINFEKSMHYNPFKYIHSEEDIQSLVTTLINNTKGAGEKEDFWVKAEKLLYMAYIGYIFYEGQDSDKNFKTLLAMLQASEVSEEDESFKNAVDQMFDELREKKPEHFAVRQYDNYKLAAGKTAKSILISCAARLAPFNIQRLLDLTEYDELELDTIGDRKTALFVIISDTDPTFNFLVSIMYTQLFNLLCKKADDEYDGSLPVHVQCLLDEFANIGQIPNFEKLIATIRSRNISAAIVLQAESQLKAIYKDSADTIIGNCDSMLFLGGKEGSTLRNINETLGKETIDTRTTSDSRGQSRSAGTNFQRTGRDLMTKDELATMNRTECILQISGLRPFKSKKFDITKHKRYHRLMDYDKKNRFDIKAYLNRYNMPSFNEMMENVSEDEVIVEVRYFTPRESTKEETEEKEEVKEGTKDASTEESMQGATKAT